MDQSVKTQLKAERVKKGARARLLPAWLVVFIDVLFIAAGLLVFALFHHVLPRDGSLKTVALPGAVKQTAPRRKEPVTIEESAVHEAVEAIEMVEPAPELTLEVPDTQAVPQYGMWGEKFSDKFTSGEVIDTIVDSEGTYQSQNVNLTLKKVQDGPFTYYTADIYIRDISDFRAGLAQDTFGQGFKEQPDALASRTDALIAINGDYYGARGKGVVVRNGILYRESLLKDVLVMYNDGSMKTFSSAEFDIDDIKQNGAWQVWSFGPRLLENGVAMTKFDSDVTVANPRSAIGYFEPGHYVFITVDGRQKGYARGMEMEKLSQIFQALGCVEAYNLDGGQTAVMMYKGGFVNKPYKGGREVSDIVMITDGVTE